MENCPEYICTWLGLSSIGVVTALINTNVKEETLAHSINILDTKAVIFGKNFSKAVQGAFPFIKKKTIEYYCYSTKENGNYEYEFSVKSLNLFLVEASPSQVDIKNIKSGFSDKLVYVYTSGTTGLPKAAIIKSSRVLWMIISNKYINHFDSSVVLYNPLPFYHTTGGLVSVVSVLIFGSKMIIVKKFSASNFWKDAVKHKATSAQYIGEICRYLLNQPKVPEETQHQIKLMFGNGIRPYVWKEFQERFKIKEIHEFYGSTEGNATLVNMFGKEEAVGFVTRLFDRHYPVGLIKINTETKEFLRNEKGLAIRCKPGEPGELVGQIIRNNPLNTYDGYVNQAETNKKIVKDCFRHGDEGFRSGDILVMDDDGYVYFVDRTGDTFRWKGENVSTGEVETILSKSLDLASCVVYGVEIPKVEGRAGMAAIQMNVEDINVEELYTSVKNKLPSYAIPIFLRFCNDLEITGTFKYKRMNLQKEGFDPAKIADPLFYLDLKKENYLPLSEEIFFDIINGKIRL